MKLTDSAHYSTDIKNGESLSSASCNDYTVPCSENFSCNLFIFLEYNRISSFQLYAGYMIL